MVVVYYYCSNSLTDRYMGFVIMFCLWLVTYVIVVYVGIFAECRMPVVSFYRNGFILFSTKARQKLFARIVPPPSFVRKSA